MQAAVEGEHARLSAALQAEQSLLTAATQRGEDSAAAQVPLRQQAEEAKGVVAIFAAKLHEAQAHLAQKDAELGDLRAELLQLSQARTLPSRAALARIPLGGSPSQLLPPPIPSCSLCSSRPLCAPGDAEGQDRGAARHADAAAAGAALARALH